MKFGLEQHIIDKMIAVFEQHSKVDKALVFGSRAKGNYRPDSDIDIAIKGQDLNTDDIIAMSVAFEEKGITHKIDLINYHTIKEPDLEDHIVRVGIELYSRWKKYTLGEISDKITDGAHLSPKDFINGKIMFSVKDMIDNGFDYTKPKTISQEDFVALEKQGCKPEIDDILIAKDGSVLKHIFRVVNEPDYVLLSSIAIIKPKQEIIDPSFLVYTLKNPKITDTILTNFVSGSGVPRIVLKDFKKVDVSVPPLFEQTAIASILTSLDDKIDLLHRQNKTLEQLAETLFRHWFVEDAEESWETKKVSEIIEIRDGTHDSPKQTETGKFLITSKHLKPTGIDFSSAYKISENDFIEVNKRSKVDKDDILFSMIGTLGLIHYVDQEPDFAIKNIGLFKSSQKPSFARFLFLLLISPEGKRFVYENADGSTQEYITLGSLRKFEFKYPGEKRIIEFDLEVKPIFQKIDSNTSQIRSLTQTRDTLLPKLMSGEVRVNLY